MLMHNLPRTMRLVVLLLATCGVFARAWPKPTVFAATNYPSYDPFNWKTTSQTTIVPSDTNGAFNYDDEAGWDGSCYAEADLLAGPMLQRRRQPRSWATSPSMAPVNLAHWLPLRRGCAWGGPFRGGGWIDDVALTLYGDTPHRGHRWNALRTNVLAGIASVPDTVLGFDMNNELSFDGWTNTNGAPLALTATRRRPTTLTHRRLPGCLGMQLPPASTPTTIACIPSPRTMRRQLLG